LGDQPVALRRFRNREYVRLALRRLADLVLRGRGAAGIWALVEAHPPIGRLLASLFGTSDFLSKAVIAHPELVAPLLLQTPQRSAAEMGLAISAALLPADDEEAKLNALRRTKNAEMLRIGLFDVASELDLAEVSRQLSDLAEGLLRATLDIVSEAVFKKRGRPDSELVVVALGKLGGRELTYSSDLDLLFVYTGEAFEIFSRVVQRLVHALSAPLDDGRLYEIDTRLRPSGQQGTLVTSFAHFKEYHRESAQLWERQALLKARVVAGAASLGREVESEIDRIVYRGGEPDGAEISRVRARMERELGRETTDRVNIKSGRGGLTDVEFLVQYLQLRHGASHPEVKQRATLDALAALAACSLLDAKEARFLDEGYRFMRRLENRLRIVQDRSIDRLVLTDRADLERLARRFYKSGERSAERLIAEYEKHAKRVRRIYQQFL
jgi:glutamate-ammonia-ligase adenylyltransferase